jgi:hypothetical protein
MKFFNVLVVALVAIIGLVSCSKDCDHDFIEHDYTNDLVGTWSVIGPDSAEALEIKADGTMKFTGVFEGEFFESMARYELANNRMKMVWDDGVTQEGRLNVVSGASFSLVIDEERGAGYYFAYCHKEFSDKVVGSWLIQTDETSEIHTYYDNGTTKTVGYYYNLGEHFETSVPGTYKVVGDILFDNVQYSEDKVLSFGARISHESNGSPFGDTLTTTSLYLQDNELLEEVTTAVRVNPSLDLASKKYNFAGCNVTNVKGESKEVEFMGYNFNFAEMDGSGLDVMLKALSFNIEFDGEGKKLLYSYKYKDETYSFDAPIEVEGNKITAKMSDKVPTLKDVMFYAFQSVDSNHLQLCMDKTSFVNFYTNMQAKLKEATDEQFDITNADSVNTIYNEINSAVETIKLSIAMEQGAN